MPPVTADSTPPRLNGQVNHYQHPSYEGTRTGWLEDTTNIGSIMNDRTSSLQWS